MKRSTKERVQWLTRTIPIDRWDYSIVKMLGVIAEVLIDIRDDAIGRDS